MVQELSTCDKTYFIVGMKESWRSKISEDIGWWWDHPVNREYYRQFMGLVNDVLLRIEKEIMAKECRRAGIDKDEIEVILKEYEFQVVV